MPYSYDTPLEFTPAGKAFKTGYDDLVQAQRLPEVFWDPVDTRWESYPAARFARYITELPRVAPGTEFWSERAMMYEVINLGRAVRALDRRIIWGPRDGYWYLWLHKASNTPPPPPPPPPTIPPWMIRLNKDLEATDQNTNLSPKERQEARSALIEAAYGKAS